ncbi:30S ribosomal protein S16, partial [bacterium]|nr:30S ribosomal protein S16 [bacterium]
MLKIKLTRLGKKKEPRYRIVVNERRDKRDGSYLESLGYYHPAEQPKQLQLDVKAYEAWVAKGAQPTATVAYLYDIAKKGKGFPEKKPSLSRKAKAKLKAEKDAKAEKAAEAKE